MSDERQKSREIRKIQQELNAGTLSRRGLLDRLKGLGIGFGAAYVLTTGGAEAHETADPAASLGSTNAALNTIIEEGQPEHLIGETQGAGTEGRELVAYRRYYFRGYRRFYARYARVYFRGYRRFYRRFYARF